MVHADEFVSTRTDSNLKLLEAVLNKEFKIKSSKICPGKEDDKELKILNRSIRYTKNGIELEADLRHAEFHN